MYPTRFLYQLDCLQTLRCSENLLPVRWIDQFVCSYLACQRKWIFVSRPRPIVFYGRAQGLPSLGYKIQLTTSLAFSVTLLLPSIKRRVIENAETLTLESASQVQVRTLGNGDLRILLQLLAV